MVDFLFVELINEDFHDFLSKFRVSSEVFEHIKDFGVDFIFDLGCGVSFFHLEGGDPFVVDGLAGSDAAGTVDIEEFGDKVLGCRGGFFPFLAGSVVLARFYEFEELVSGLCHERWVAN